MRQYLSYLYSPTGYQLTYKDQKIGGAGLNLVGASKIDWRTKRKDAEMFKKLAISDIEHLIDGTGEERYLKEIKKIDNNNKI